MTCLELWSHQLRALQHRGWQWRCCVFGVCINIFSLLTVGMTSLINDYQSMKLLVCFESICLQRSSRQSQCDFAMYLDAAIGFGMQRHVARTKSGETGLR